jgi:hypothetical protein
MEKENVIPSEMVEPANRVTTLRAVGRSGRTQEAKTREAEHCKMRLNPIGPGNEW